MSVVKLTPDAPFWSGITRIQRKESETQEQFDATKDQATFQVGQDTHTLTLDGKVDDIILQGLNPYYQSDRLITDIRQLSGKATELREACLKSEDAFANAEVDLGTGNNWYCFPQKDSQTHQTYGYELISGPGPQTLSVRLEDNGVVDVCVSSKDEVRDLGHSMRAKITPDGSCEPTLEGVSWQLAR